MSKKKRDPQPMQRVQWDGDGVIRFRRNAIVSYMLDWASSRGMSVNELARMPFDADDWTQLAQLIGYSVSGAGELDYFDRDVLDCADLSAEKLAASPSREEP